MLNRVKNVGYGDRTPFLNAAASLNLRGEIDRIIDTQVEQWYATVPQAAHGRQHSSATGSRLR
ncbi:hypothetical protein ALP10_200053 [Pseudomonas syringae pv. helianthi]|uniref:Uncharacterized protein n=1 Tax=Pseudomonas syringae pv. helianthi TaxID=251654 RepID=A0A3M6CKZ7_9PSED|nr:hypothetical protein ALP10_200053 [Pseudomonas syringae pv. helianthi]